MQESSKESSSERFIAKAISFSTQLRRRLRIAATGPVSALGWEVLDHLKRHGPTTVPKMARNRANSRQNIQVIVVQLLQGGWIASQPNPNHKRSPLFQLTPTGAALLDGAKNPEQEVLQMMDKAATPEELEEATALLSRLEQVLAAADSDTRQSVDAPEPTEPAPDPEALDKITANYLDLVAEHADVLQKPEPEVINDSELPTNLL